MSIKQVLGEAAGSRTTATTPAHCADDDAPETTVEQKPRNSGKIGDMTPDTEYRGDHILSAEL